MNHTPSELAHKLLYEMLRIRLYEEEIAKRYSEQKMRCPTHLSIGQEAVPAAISQALTKEDLAVSSHRAHAHYLGKGGSGPKMIAEIYGKKTGCSQGKGGSMHLIDLSVGFKGSTAIVGNTIPIGVGLGLALKLQKKQNISVIFLGDGAIEEGVFYESVNFAALKNLPVLFICENNFYSVYSHIKARQPEGRAIFKMVESMGLHSSIHDGNDALSCYQAIREARDRLIVGGKPEFLEFTTYRWREHCGPNYDNNIGYRTEAEFLEWKEKDPILRLEKLLFEQKQLSVEKLNNFKQQVENEVTQAFIFAEESPFPEKYMATKHLFAGSP